MFLMERYDDESPINLGVGSDVSIKDLAGMIKEMTGYLGEIRFDISRPDGALVKLLDSSRLQSLGWQPRIPLREGLERTYAWYLQNMEFPSPLPTGKGQGTMTGS
jgi:GDP-L-fucose synthase